MLSAEYGVWALLVHEGVNREVRNRLVPAFSGSSLLSLLFFLKIESDTVENGIHVPDQSVPSARSGIFIVQGEVKSLASCEGMVNKAQLPQSNLNFNNKCKKSTSKKSWKVHTNISKCSSGVDSSRGS